MTALKVLQIIVRIVHILLIVNSRFPCDAEDVEFSYIGATGPALWGSLSPEFIACGNGTSQSPINIVDEEAMYNNNLQPLSRQYGLSNATLVNNGHNVQLVLGDDSGSLHLNGKAYTLKQMHWHTPSEHLINGIQYDAELHLVHTANDGSTSVISSLYRLGAPDKLIAQLESELARLIEISKVEVRTFDTKQLEKNAVKYYKYGGSLTTPPCTENVIWQVIDEVGSISRHQVEVLKAPLRRDCKENARPSQPLYGRKVHAYTDI